MASLMYEGISYQTEFKIALKYDRVGLMRHDWAHMILYDMMQYDVMLPYIL